jgi:monolysocardiolipin acyltransferase
MGSVSRFIYKSGMKLTRRNSSRIIMDAETMPEIIPIWISRFDTLMPETRGWPRPVPRKGGEVSITIGKSLTSTIQPLIEEWKTILRSRPKEKTKTGTGEKQVIGRSEDMDHRERDIRIRICRALQDGVHALGVNVEREEGRFENGEWSNSTKRLDTRAAKEQPGERSGETPI